jgi:hypothetical protein
VEILDVEAPSIVVEEQEVETLPPATGVDWWDWLLGRRRERVEVLRPVRCSLELHGPAFGVLEPGERGRVLETREGYARVRWDRLGRKSWVRRDVLGEVV